MTTAAAFLAERNQLIVALLDVDEKLDELFGREFSNRTYAECRELLDIRTDIADQLVVMGGDPGLSPVERHQHETSAV